MKYQRQRSRGKIFPQTKWINNTVPLWNYILHKDMPWFTSSKDIISSKDINIFYSHLFIPQTFTECQLYANCCGYWDKRQSPSSWCCQMGRWLPTSSHLPATASWRICLPFLILYNTASLSSGSHVIPPYKDLSSNQNSSAFKT